MDETIKFIGTLTAIINACEDYKRLDVNNDHEAMQAESISYNTIREELERYKEKVRNYDMNRPGQNIKTRTINVDGVIKELLNTLEVRLNNTWNDWHDEDVLGEYLVQDLETYNGSVELMYKLELIDKDRWDQETDNGYNLYNKILTKTA